MILPLVAFFLGATLPPGNLPFRVTATEDVSGEYPGAPRIQSFSFAQWKGRWVFIGGRIAGYHGVGGSSADFSRLDANRDVWVMDTTVHPARTYHVPLDTLPASFSAVKDQWSATAQLYVQDGPKLYISGGYGQNHAGNWTTFPLLSRVDLPSLIDAVMRGRLPAKGIAYTETPLAKASGGALIKLHDGYFYLIMGHAFEGSYSAFEGQRERNAPVAAQNYLQEIRKLKITDDSPGQLNVSLVEKDEDPTEFHRRDFTATQTLSPKGLGLAAYGGVFTPETQLNFSRPIYLFPGSHPTIDTNFEQKMNSYSCPALLLYDRASATGLVQVPYLSLCLN